MNRRYIDFVPHQSTKTAAADSDFDDELKYETIKTPETEAASERRIIDDFISRPNVNRAKKGKTVKPVEPVEPIDPADTVDPADTADLTDTADPTDTDGELIDNLSVNDAPLDTRLTIEEILLAREEPEDTETITTTSVSYGLGMVEDYTPIDSKKPAFINATKVEKRPLSGNSPEVAKSSKALEEELKAAKSEDLTKRPLDGEKPVVATKADDTFKKPKFINTHLVEKRPLSKTDYRSRAPKVVEEVASGPVTIIDKPEKDSRLGFIITIIITILLGAAVGTVAFLLIPR